MLKCQALQTSFLNSMMVQYKSGLGLTSCSFWTFTERTNRSLVIHSGRRNPSGKILRNTWSSMVSLTLLQNVKWNLKIWNKNILRQLTTTTKVATMLKHAPFLMNVVRFLHATHRLNQLLWALVNLVIKKPTIKRNIWNAQIPKAQVMKMSALVAPIRRLLTARRESHLCQQKES